MVVRVFSLLVGEIFSKCLMLIRLRWVLVCCEVGLLKQVGRLFMWVVWMFFQFELVSSMWLLRFFRVLLMVCLIGLVLMIRQLLGEGLVIFSRCVRGWVVVFCRIIVLMIIRKVSGISSVVWVWFLVFRWMVKIVEIVVVMILCGVIQLSRVCLCQFSGEFQVDSVMFSGWVMNWISSSISSVVGFRLSRVLMFRCVVRRMNRLEISRMLRFFLKCRICCMLMFFMLVRFIFIRVMVSSLDLCIIWFEVMNMFSIVVSVVRLCRQFGSQWWCRMMFSVQLLRMLNRLLQRIILLKVCRLCSQLLFLLLEMMKLYIIIVSRVLMGLMMMFFQCRMFVIVVLGWIICSIGMIIVGLVIRVRVLNSRVIF